MKQIPWISSVLLGHASDEAGGTGCTVLLCPKGATAGVDVRGGAPATRETDLLKSVNMVEQIHGLMLSGGSAFGLDAASGAMRFLEEQGIGLDVGVAKVPIVCGASLFDLQVGDASCRPDGAMGYEACRAAFAGQPLMEGNVGAGTGATVGKFLGPDRMMKSGLGIYAVQVGDLQVAAVVAVNALGDVVDCHTGEILAGLLDETGQGFQSTTSVMLEQYAQSRDVFSGNTTIGCVVTNAKLTKTQANKLASVAHNAYARTIRPVHTMADGDSIFVLSTGEVSCVPDAIGVLAVDVLAMAVNRAVLTAAPAYGLKAHSTIKGRGTC